MENLPKGKENRKVRQPIYDEKNLFINRGKEIDRTTGIRGSDGRQAYLHALEETLSMTEQWIKNGANAWSAYIMFRDKNIEMGYQKRGEIF